MHYHGHAAMFERAGFTLQGASAGRWVYRKNLEAVFC